MSAQSVAVPNTLAVPGVAVPQAASKNHTTGQEVREELTRGAISEGKVASVKASPVAPLVRGRVRFDEAALKRRWHADEDGHFPCPLPGHGGTAFLVYPDDDDGEVRLACCEGHWRSLGEVRMAEALERDTWHPSNIRIAIWTRLLAYETGTFEPLNVLVPALPPGASKDAHTAREGFRLLIGLRWADGEHRAVAYSVRFVAGWCSIGKWQAHEGVRALLKYGVIHEAGRAGSYGRVPLYLPGGGDA
jgi:hypothetical protein